MQRGGWGHKAIIIIKDSGSTQPLMNSFIQSIGQSAFIVSPHSQKALNSSLFQETYFCWNNSQPWLRLSILRSLGAASGDVHISGPSPPRSPIQCFDGVLNICVQTCNTVPLCHYQVLRFHECLPPVFLSLVTNTVYSHLLAGQINFIRTFFSSHRNIHLLDKHREALSQELSLYYPSMWSPGLSSPVLTKVFRRQQTLHRKHQGRFSD